MAFKNAKVSRASQGAQSVTVVTWELGPGDIGTPVELTDFADRSVQVVGLFGGGNISIEGSNDGENWFVLRDPHGTRLAFGTADLKQIMETSRYTRCISSGLDNVAATVTMCLRMGTPLSWSR